MGGDSRVGSEALDTLSVVEHVEVGRRSPKTEQRRLSIIRTATEVINAKSFAMASMKEIAAKLDLRDAALYYYFEDKRALGFACHVHTLKRLESVLEDTARAGGTGLDRVRSFIAGMLDDSVRNGPQLYLGDLSYLSVDQHAAVTGWMNRLKGRLRHFLEDGIADGTISPCETELVVQLLMGMLIWLAKWTPSVGELTVERLMQAICVVSFRGLERRDG